MSRTCIIANQLRRFPLGRLLRFASQGGKLLLSYALCVYVRFWSRFGIRRHVGNEGGAVDTETDRIIEEVFCYRWRRGACSTSVGRWRFL